MKRINIFFFLSAFLPLLSNAQYSSGLTREKWVDSVFSSMSQDEKITQLMIIRAHSNLGPDHVAKVAADIKKYNVGGLCFFQGGPVRQADLTNYYQSIAKTPLLITIDAEWGLGMRLDSVTKFPYQLTLGALNDAELVYKMGLAVGEQCKRIGVHVNYAPVVDVNNNPDNPVIGYRSFGEDKTKVSELGVAYMGGMQDAGIMACAKHFPGHGDVSVDSHYDLPVINKSKQQLEEMELVPFRSVFNAGIKSVMIAHLYIPSIDNTANRATSLSRNNVTDLLKKEMGYNGLVFTDALEMKGVAKFFPGGTISVEALVAGNDMLCLPESVKESLAAIKKAIRAKRLSWNDIDEKVKKVLAAKYDAGLFRQTIIDTDNLAEDLNRKTDEIRREVAGKSITVLSLAGNKASRTDYAQIPLNSQQKKIAYVGIGEAGPNTLSRRLQQDLNADVFFFSYKDGQDKADEILKQVPKDGKYDAIIVGVHNYSLRPANNFGISQAAVQLYKDLNFIKTITLTFGNVLATRNFCGAWTLAACYQDDDITQDAAADLLEGKSYSMGKLPVSFCDYKPGDGIVHGGIKPMKAAVDKTDKFYEVDSIVEDALAEKAFPGCVILAAHKGKIAYHKAFGYYDYNSNEKVTTQSIYDLASVTKVSATTVSVMKLYEEGKLDIDKTIGDYLPVAKGTNKSGIRLRDLLLHQAGLVPYIAFYKETLDAKTGKPYSSIYSSKLAKGFDVRVAENMYIRNGWSDIMFDEILKSPLGPKNKYVYSDNDFIFLGKIVEQITGMTLDEYARKNFYEKLGMKTTGFLPRKRFPVDRIVPTETDDYFRRQIVRGDVHDEGAAMFGGIAGHAGLFSDAYDLSLLYQMLLNGGELNGIRYLKPETIKMFSDYGSDISRRGLGFDKPEKDNAEREEPYPSSLASPETFGHTGFTGTCVWVDPKNDMLYIFLSNRVNPTRNNPKLGRMNIRSKIQDAIYRAVGIQ